MLDIDTTIEAQERQAGKKGDARKLRASNGLPAVLYGPGQASRYLTLNPKLFVMQRKRFGAGALYNLSIAGAASGAKAKCLIKDIQVHPVTRLPLHVDLYAVDMKRPLKVEVPIELTGKAAGIVDGGLLSQVLRSVEVLCLPDEIPANLVGDVTPLKIGDSLHLSDLALPAGVKLTAHGDEAVAIVSEPDTAPATPSEEAAAAGAAPAAAGADAAKKPADAKKAGDKK